MTSLDSEVEFVQKSQNVRIYESYVAVPESELSPNRHLYTASKKPMMKPLMCSRSTNGIYAMGPSDPYSYVLKGVSELSQKGDEDWVIRRFNSPVSLTKRSFKYS